MQSHKAPQVLFLNVILTAEVTAATLLAGAASAWSGILCLAALFGLSLLLAPKYLRLAAASHRIVFHLGWAFSISIVWSVCVLFPRLATLYAPSRSPVWDMALLATTLRLAALLFVTFCLFRLIVLAGEYWAVRRTHK